MSPGARTRPDESQATWPPSTTSGPAAAACEKPTPGPSCDGLNSSISGMADSVRPAPEATYHSSGLDLAAMSVRWQRFDYSGGTRWRGSPLRVQRGSSSVLLQKFAGILRLRTSRRASGGPGPSSSRISDALLLVPPLPSPRRPDRQPAAGCHNPLDELPKQATSSSGDSAVYGDFIGFSSAACRLICRASTATIGRPANS